MMETHLNAHELAQRVGARCELLPNLLAKLSRVVCQREPTKRQKVWQAGLSNEHCRATLACGRLLFAAVVELRVTGVLLA